MFLCNCCDAIALFYTSIRGPSSLTVGAVSHLATRSRQWTAKQLASPMSHLMRQKKDFSWMHSVGDDSGERGRGRNEHQAQTADCLQTGL